MENYNELQTRKGSPSTMGSSCAEEYGVGHMSKSFLVVTFGNVIEAETLQYELVRYISNGISSCQHDNTFNFNYLHSSISTFIATPLSSIIHLLVIMPCINDPAKPQTQQPVVQQESEQQFSATQEVENLQVKAVKKPGSHHNKLSDDEKKALDIHNQGTLFFSFPPFQYNSDARNPFASFFDAFHSLARH